MIHGLMTGLFSGILKLLQRLKKVWSNRSVALGCKLLAALVDGLANRYLPIAISCTPPALLTSPDAIDGLGPGLYQSECEQECAAPLLRNYRSRFPAEAG
jgi:hypothetical protein